jgi:hypothetical protein
MGKEFFSNIKLLFLTTMLSIGFSIPANGINPADTTKWHPKEFYIIYPDKKITLKLPYEEDQTGVRNLLFQHKKTDSLYLLDEEHSYIRNEITTSYRKYTRFRSGKYDVILLYNNGKYVKYNDISFEENACIEMDMTKSVFQPSDSKSEQWLTMRAFNTPINNAQKRGKTESNKQSIASGTKIRGYLFADDGECLPGGVIRISADDSDIIAVSGMDGYFEAELYKESQLLHILPAPDFLSVEIFVTVDCGIFVVSKTKPDSGKTFIFSMQEQ